VTARNLLTDPRWRAEDLGFPLPDSLHAVSVALPRWQDVVDYEEHKPDVVNRLQCGYPRFVIHPLVAALARHIGGDQPCLPFPSASTAQRCAHFISAHTGERSTIAEQAGVFGVMTTPSGGAALRAFWQHAGVIVSSRKAEAALDNRSDDADGDSARRSLRRQLATLYDCADTDVFLTPTGMAAQFAALRAVMARRPGLPTVQLGFPYVDTLKLQQKLGHGGILLHDLSTIADDVRAVIARQPLAACFGEIPCNPLLGSPDLAAISPLLRQHGIAFVADDVMASPINVDAGRFADLVATSLTKFVAGTCDVMGGAVLCNPRSPLYAELHALLTAQHEELLWGEDAVVLDAQARTFPDRMTRHNANGLLIAERLRAHPAVERVWYPKWEYASCYEAVRRQDGGWGSLLSLLLKRADQAAARFYDNLAVCKGPSLGTAFTIACPFTLLAHYGELDWAESCGVSRYLIRVSVGVEDAEDLWQRFDRGLGA